MKKIKNVTVKWKLYLLFQRIIFQNNRSVYCIPILWICTQLTWSTQDKKWNFHFNRNYSKCLWCLTVSLSTQILILVITPISFISVSILCEFATLPDVYILLSPQQEELHCSSWGNRCTYLAAQLSKRLNTLSVIILVCLSNT